MADRDRRQGDEAIFEPRAIEGELAASTGVFTWDTPPPRSANGSRPTSWLDADTMLLSGRFIVRECLGSGGMGTVYRAVDTKVGADVALKVLHLRDATGILHLKREFRALANLAHPNLIDLYELYCDESNPALPRWFFTMRLVIGEDFHTALRAAPAPGSPCDFEKLRRLLPQLVSGVSALHGADKLHRDLKPSNVLVDASGQVVILDFGVAKDLHEETLEEEAEAGTPPYMAPELYVGSAKASRETDWYSVGVLLFQVMTGQIFRRGSRERASSLVAGVPPDLDRLCADLLATEPHLRPTGPEIADRLGVSLEPAVVDLHRTFVGRAAELDRLAALYGSLAPGAPLITTLEGPSGIGKTALAHHFAALVQRRYGALVLKSRCYEREMVPFKAIDAIIDELSEELAHGEHDPELDPKDAACAVRVFPVLGRVRAFAVADDPLPDTTAQKIRERGFEALARQIERLARSRGVLLLIDDAQWGDPDSAKFLAALLMVATSARLMLLVTHRSRERADGVMQRALLERLRAAQAPFRLEAIELPVMSRDESRKLAETMTGSADSASDRLLEESGGLPLFVCELANLSARAPSDGAPPSINGMLESRIQRLPNRARSLLEVLAVASRPIERRLALEAADVPLEDIATLHVLDVGRLATTNVGPSGSRLETYHDRIREGIIERLSRDRIRELHVRLAETLERAGDAEPEWLLVHYLGAGRQVLARRAARDAAERADRALAFDHAAALYRQILELDPEAADRWELSEKMGNALANAGRSGLAAEAFDQATQWHVAGNDSDAATLLRLRHRAAEHYLQSARADQGIEVIKSVLREQGLAFPSSNGRASLTILGSRLRLMAKGYDFRRSHVKDPALEASLESLFVASKSLAFVSPLPATLFACNLALKSFEAGHGRYLACALSIVASQDTMMEVDYLYRRAERLLELVARVAGESGDAYELGFYHLGRAATAWFRGRFAEAVSSSEAAFELFSSLGRSASYEIAVSHLWGLHSLGMTGNLRKLAQRTNDVRRDALERGDIFCERNAVLGQGVLVRLASDEPELALQRAEAAMQVPPPEFAVHNYHFLVTRAYVEWYLGRPERAWQHVVDAWPGVVSGFFDKLACARDELLHLRAHAAVALAANLGRRDTAPAPKGRRLDRNGLLKLAAGDASAIASHRLPQCAPFAALIRASLARVNGDAATARDELGRAARGFDAAEMALYREVSDYCRERLAGPAAETSAPRAWFHEHGVVRPERLARALAPAL